MNAFEQKKNSKIDIDVDVTRTDQSPFIHCLYTCAALVGKDKQQNASVSAQFSSFTALSDILQNVVRLYGFGRLRPCLASLKPAALLAPLLALLIEGHLREMINAVHRERSSPRASSVPLLF